MFFGSLFLLGASMVPGQQTPAPTERQTAPSSYGETIFSRGDADSPAATQSAPKTKPEPAQTPAASLVFDAERTALTFTSYNFEVHLDPARHSISVKAHLTARNDGAKPLGRIALQLSSALSWYSIHVDGKTVKFQTESIESDIDHTGRLTEAVAPLSTPVAPGKSVDLDVIYSGTMQQSAERLLRLGAPAKIADASEWDRVGPSFTALRGFGNAIWFPVSTAPVLLGEGARMFDSVGKWKLRQSGAQISMHVLVEYLDTRPNIAFLNGYAVQPDPESPGPGVAATPVHAPDSASDTTPRVASFTLPRGRLGFSALSLMVMNAPVSHFPGMDVYSRDGNEQSAKAYEKIAENSRPLIEQWLGSHPKRPVLLVGLPDSDDLPFEDRNILLLPLKANPVNDSAGPVLAHMLSHSYFISPRPWLEEGVAQWMTLLWIEQRAGRTTAIGQMESHRAALALAETSDPGVDPGQSLIDAWSDIYYRDKAADVLWMLRDLAGDVALGKTLTAYKSTEDREPAYFQRLLQKASGKDLEWFFDDWVYRDRGLPDLHIASAYRRPILTKNSSVRNSLVSVDVHNDSFCSAEVPVTVESASATQTRRLLVPSHTRSALRVLSDSAPERAIVNDGSVPEVRTTRHSQPIRPAQ